MQSQPSCPSLGGHSLPIRCAAQAAWQVGGDCCTMCQLDCTAAGGTLGSGFTHWAAAAHTAVPTCSNARNFMMDRFTAG